MMVDKNKGVSLPKPNWHTVKKTGLFGLTARKPKLKKRAKKVTTRIPRKTSRGSTVGAKGSKARVAYNRSIMEQRSSQKIRMAQKKKKK